MRLILNNKRLSHRYYHIYQPLCSGRIWHKVNFKQSLTGLNSEFSFSYTSCLIKAEEPSLPYYLAIAGGRIIGFIPFPRVLVLCEMQSVSYRIWTRVTVSMSYDNNHYTTGTSPRYYTLLIATANIVYDNFYLKGFSIILVQFLFLFRKYFF